MSISVLLNWLFGFSAGFLLKTFLALLILVITIPAGILPSLKHKTQKKLFPFSTIESFASGVFLGAALLHMLPDSAHEFFISGYQYPYPFLIAGSVFLGLLLIEQFERFSKLPISLGPLSSGRKLILLGAVMLSIHALLEGAALGASSTLGTTLIIFIAVIAHKSAASFALSTELNKKIASFKARLMTFGLFAIMTPIGIFLGSSVLSLEASPFLLLAPILNSMAAGTFLYIGTLHGLQEANLIRHCANLKEFFFMLLGFSLMGIIAAWA
jgi:hypothetical protein